MKYTREIILVIVTALISFSASYLMFGLDPIPEHKWDLGIDETCNVNTVPIDLKNGQIACIPLENMSNLCNQVPDAPICDYFTGLVNFKNT